MDMPGTRAAERYVEQSLRAEQDREQRADRPTSCGQSPAGHQDGKNDERQLSGRGCCATSGEMAQQSKAACAEPDDRGPDRAENANRGAGHVGAAHRRRGRWRDGHTLRLTPGDMVGLRAKLSG
ncbi:MAG: hypothetical protein QOD68_272 [Actinomycetota bacterium]|nr:hypothetical protein [Actinomycetota bacterium]